VPLEEWLGMLERVNIKDDDWQKKSGPGTTETVSASDPTRMVSLAIAAIDHIPTVKELVESIVRGAEEGLKRLDLLKEG
jgi:hypothetical protein